MLYKILLHNNLLFQMKKTLFLLLLPFFFSCSSTTYTQIGQVNMISNRNVSSLQEYTLLSKFTSASPKQISNSTAQTINDAIDNVVKTIPGGEYLMNVKLYRNSSGFYAAEGDVWGIGGKRDINGMKVQDVVIWNKKGKVERVKILEFKADQEVSVLTSKNRIEKVDISDLLPDSSNTSLTKTVTPSVEPKQESQEKSVIKILTKEGEEIEGVLLKSSKTSYTYFDTKQNRKRVIFKHRIETVEIKEVSK